MTTENFKLGLGIFFIVAKILCVTYWGFSAFEAYKEDNLKNLILDLFFVLVLAR